MVNDGSVDVLIQKQAIDNIAVANAALEKTLKLILEVNSASRKGASAGGSPNSAEKINKANQASIQRLKLADQTLVMQKKLVQSEINLKNALSAENAEIQKNRFELQRRNTLLKEEIKLASPLVGAYEKLTLKLNKLRRSYKDVAASEGLASKNAIKLRKEVERLDSRLKKVDASAGQFQRSVGNYPKQMGAAIRGLRSLASALGLVGGAFLIVRVIGNAIEAVKRFEKANATLSAVLQLEKKDMQALMRESKRLGAITAKTAEQVVGLQVAYARLGFSQSEIIDLTEATISGSIAMNAELNDTANLVGAIVNTFDDFSSIDAPQIIDVLSLATAKSALNFQKLEKGIPIVAGAANAAGVSFTKLVALMGKLADSGIDVSTSSTAIRNIFIQAKAKGADYNEILEMIKGSQDKLTASNDEFGRRAAVSASVLSNNIDAIKELDEALQDAAGTAQQMADKELDTLTGALTLLSSAWSGLILNVEDGEGGLANMFRGAIEAATTFLSKLTDINTISEGYFSFAAGVWRSFIFGQGEAVKSEAELIRTQEERLELMKKLSEFRIKQAKEIGIIITKSQIQEELQHTSNEQLKEMIKEFEKLAKVIPGGGGEDDVTKKTIDFYKNIISETKKLRDSTAETRAEYESFTQTILDAENALFLLENTFKRFTGLQQGAAVSGSAISGGISTPELADTRTDAGGNAISALQVVSSEEFELARQNFDQLSELGLTLLDRKIAAIDAEIQAEEDKYAMLFALAEGDAEQQRLLAIEREENLQKLEKKRRKEEKKQAIFNKAQALINIAINTAVTVTKVGAETGLLGIALAPLIIALGAAQAATVLATPIPQFAKGGTMDKDGLAVVGDGGRKEVIKNPDGSIQVTPDKSTLVNLKKGAEIIPSIDAFNQDSNFDISDKIYSATVIASLSINNDKITSYLETQKIFNDKLLGAMLQVDDSIKKQKLRSTHNSQRIDIADELFKMKYD